MTRRWIIVDIAKNLWHKSMARHSSGIIHVVEEQAIVSGKAMSPAIKSLDARLHKQTFVCVRKETRRTTNMITVKFAARINNDKTTRLAHMIIADEGSGSPLQTLAVKFVMFSVSAIIKLLTTNDYSFKSLSHLLFVIILKYDLKVGPVLVE